LPPRVTADRTHGDPGGIVALGHHPLGEALEAVLHLRAGILLVGAVPSDRDQALGTDHRPRVIVAIGQVFAEMLDGILTTGGVTSAAGGLSAAWAPKPITKSSVASAAIHLAVTGEAEMENCKGYT
jgi:hypothetical protein